MRPETSEAHALEAQILRTEARLTAQLAALEHAVRRQRRRGARVDAATASAISLMSEAWQRTHTVAAWLRQVGFVDAIAHARGVADAARDAREEASATLRLAGEVAVLAAEATAWGAKVRKRARPVLEEVLR